MKALLINPYIYDFSAYSFWSSPLGLLYVGSILRQNGMDITLLDCMRTVEEKRKPDGRVPFLKEKVHPPGSLAAIRKRLKRYGISPALLRAELSAFDTPDLVLITSIMTYWYQGALEAADIARSLFPHSKIILGGIYPTLCHDHALAHMRNVDLVIRHSEMEMLYDYIEDVFFFPIPFRPSPYDLNRLPYPAFDLYESIPFIPLLTSYGCAFKCTYCATPYMHPRMVRRDPTNVIDEIRYWHDRKIARYVIYDDNFLYQSASFAKPLLTQISMLPFPITIYNPNAVNAAFIDDHTADLLFRAGFQEVRLGLETTDAALLRSTGGKVDLKAFENALRHLSRAGFSMDRIGVYILAGLPLQKAEQVKSAIDYLSGFGLRIHIAEYTPIPHTPLYDQYQTLARYPIAKDPIYQNNALFPFAWEDFTDENLSLLKHHVREINAQIGSHVTPHDSPPDHA